MTNLHIILAVAGIALVALSCLICYISELKDELKRTKNKLKNVEDRSIYIENAPIKNNSDYQIKLDHLKQVERIHWNRAINTNDHPLCDVLQEAVYKAEKYDVQYGGMKVEKKISTHYPDNDITITLGRCPNCNVNIAGSDRFCSKCGIKLDWGEQHEDLSN